VTDLASAVDVLLRGSDTLVGPKPTVVIKWTPAEAGYTPGCTPTVMATCDICSCHVSYCSGGGCCY
jgi:hypothetical protein